MHFLRQLTRRYAISIFACFSIFIPQIFASNTKNIIYVYKDEGVSRPALAQALDTFHSILPHPYEVKTIDAESIINNQWAQDAALFIMPGGADLLYAKKLDGQGNRNIKDYVRKGGAYLGLCAGAYYASSSVVFDEGGPLEVLGTRELAFFKGRSIGPVLAKYQYQSESGSCAAHIRLPHQDLQDADIYYNGGGYFENANHFQNTNIIGFYENGLPAIIHINYGKGHVVLSGVHFEYEPAYLSKKDPYSAKIIDRLAASNQARLALVRFVLKQLELAPIVINV